MSFVRIAIMKIGLRFWGSSMLVVLVVGLGPAG